MATVSRLSAVWSGFTGAPGISRFSFANLTDATTRDAAGTAIRTLFDSIKAYIPSGVQIQVQSGIDEFDMASGTLTGAASLTSLPAVVTSTATAQPWVGGAGLVLTWNTSVIFNGHRVKGRTFIVPAALPVFANDGTLDSSLLTTIQNAGNALATGNPNFSVWSKMFTKVAPITQIGGALAPVDTCTVKDAASQLRTRRT